MKIAAILVWFDEPLHALHRCVTSLAGFAETLYAVDGAWQHYPYRSHVSPLNQYETIELAANEIGLEVRCPEIPEPFESQVAKRSYAYSTAQAATGCDWILVIDGDECLTHTDPDALDRLAATSLDVATINCDRYRNGNLSKQRPIRRLFRTSVGLSVADTHNHVVTADGRNLGGDRGLEREPALDLTACITLRHDAWNRGAHRNQQAKHYYATVHREVGRH